jgi:hypothetical protein
MRSDDLINTTFTIRDFRLEDGDYGEYAIITIDRGKGEDEEWVCSSVGIMGQLIEVRDKGKFPVQGKLVRDGRRLKLV